MTRSGSGSDSTRPVETRQLTSPNDKMANTGPQETRISIDLINGVATSILDFSCSLPCSTTELGFGSTCSIYKVPDFMRKKNETSYRPLVLSIGPFYYKDPQLETMQELKHIFLKGFLHEQNAYENLEDYHNIAREFELRARAYYQDKISLSSDEFIEMLVLDAVFIIYLFMVSTSRFRNILWIGNKLGALSRYRSGDLFLLENQLPYFILEELYNRAFGVAFPGVSFREITLNYLARASVSGFNVAKSDVARRRIITEVETIENLVDFWRICFLPRELRGQQQQQPSQVNGGLQASWTAKELVAAGVKFVPSNDEALTVKFHNGILEIPKFHVGDYAERFYFNLQLFEQFHHFKDTYFIDFIYFLDKIIDTVEDVKVLLESKILVNMLGSEQEVADLINKAGKNIYIRPKNYYYSDVTKRVNEYANAKWNQWRSTLKREYFKHPWAIISVIYAILLLFLTLAQTIGTFTNSQSRKN